MKFEKEIPKLLNAGKILIGKEGVLNAIRNGRAKTVVAAINCPYIDELKEYEVKVEEFPDDSLKLGALCNKNFKVSSLAVVEEDTNAKV